MRILTLSNCLLRANEGSGQVVLILTEGLRQRGHEIDLFGPDDYEICPSLRPRANAYRQALGMWRFVRARLRARRYDLLEIYGGEAWLTFVALSKCQAQRPLLVAHSNGLEPHVRACLKPVETGQRHCWQVDQSPWMASGFRRADGLVVVSDFDREFARRENYQEKEQLVTVEPGLAPEFLGLPFVAEREPIIGFCGNWLPIKGIDLICRAMPAILRQFNQARFKLIGVGADFRVDEWFPNDVSTRVEAIPWLNSRSELIAQYRSLSILIRPSYFESFGLAGAEAMACGAAAISSKGGFGSAMRHGEDGLVIDPLNVENLLNACRQLITNEALRRRLAEHGYRRVQALRWQSSITKLENTYLHWLDDYRRSSLQ